MWERCGQEVSARPNIEAGLHLDPGAGIPPGWGRRSLDVGVSLLVIGLTLPLLLALLLAAPLSTGGSAIYRQRRVGQGGVPFTLYKFRTMRAGASGPEVTAPGDSRVTRLGAVLRRTSVDELPQMVNVLLGHMTLVGPRPESVALARRYPAELRSIFRYRPGVTGPSQVLLPDEKFLRNVSDVEDSYLRELMPRRVATDMTFLDNATLASTIHWLAETARYLIAVIAPRPASQAAVEIQPQIRD